MIITGKYPNLRMRRNRRTDWVRRLVEENNITSSDLILPIFLVEGKNKKQEITNMPGVYRYSLNKLHTILEKAIKFSERRDLSPEEKQSLAMWEHCLDGLRDDPLSLNRECDWVAKYHLLERYRRKYSLDLSDPKIALLDLQYHDVDRLSLIHI